ncbi:glycosyltransferase [Bosea sp. LjRoot9]|uniref:glycosyltransferase n=1 Tax=Bosea sp. LjRoot9 TaxID=3342341 RepID=UPI003ED05F06
MDGLIDMDESLSVALSAHGLSADARILEFRSRAISAPTLRKALTPDIVAIFLRRDSADQEPFWPFWPLAFDLGFVPVACDACGDLFLRSSHVTGISRLGGKARGQVTMSSLGSNGRFANQIFQHVYVKFYGLRYGCRVTFPEWDGNGIYTVVDPKPEAPLPTELRYYAFDNDDIDLWKLEAPPVDADFWGYFQELPACWAPHRQLLRRLYELEEAQAADVERRLSALTEGDTRPLIAIHVRRGDYVELHKNGLPWYRPVPEAWYADWLDAVFAKHPDAVLYVATDAPDEVLPAFARFRAKSLSDVETVPGLPPAMLDFEIMRRAGQLAVCNSSFSRMAAILAPDSQNAVIADFDGQRLTPFDAWSFEPFWSRFEGKGLEKQSPILGYGAEPRRQRNLELRRQAALGLQTYRDLTKLAADYNNLAERHQQLDHEHSHLLSQIGREAVKAADLTAQLQQARNESAHLQIAIRGEILRRPSRIVHRSLFRSLYLGTRVGRRLLGPTSGFVTAHLSPMIDALREYRHREALRLGRQAAGSLLRRFSILQPASVASPQAPAQRAKTPNKTRAWQETGSLSPVVVNRPFEMLRPDGPDFAEQIEQSAAEILAIPARGLEALTIEQWLTAGLLLAEQDIDALVTDASPEAGLLFVRRSAILQGLPANKRLKRGLAPKAWIARLRDGLSSGYSCASLQPGANDVVATALGPHHPLLAADAIGGAERLEAALLSLPTRRRDDERPHCLVVVPWLPMGGSEVVLLDVLGRLAKDWRITIVTMLPSEHAMRGLFATVAQDILHAGDLLDADRLVATLAALVQVEGSRAILTSNSSLTYERAPELKARFPHLAFIDIVHNDLAEGHIRNAARYSAAFSTHIAISAKVRNSLVARGIPAERVKLIPNGIDTDLFQPAADRASLKAECGVAAGDILLGFVGRLSGEKRPDKFLDVVSRLSGALPIRAIMVGDGEELPQLQKRIATENLPVRIIAKLDRSNLPRLYGALDILVMTSSIEGMPLVMLEALACGTPVASTRVGDVERIIRDGENGFLASVDHVEVLADGIRGAAQAGRLAGMRDQARESIITSGMTRDAMLDGYAEVMSGVLARA